MPLRKFERMFNQCFLTKSKHPYFQPQRPVTILAGILEIALFFILAHYVNCLYFFACYSTYYAFFVSLSLYRVFQVILNWACQALPRIIGLLGMPFLRLITN